jgi:ribonuclease-3
MAKSSYLSEEVEERLRYRFKNRALLDEAFCHRSYVGENPLLLVKSNERLEFLGDAVLALIVSGYLFEKYPELAEGKLTQKRAQLVEKRALVRYANKLQVFHYLHLSKGEESLQRKKDSIYADLFEAILGAIYLDGGLNQAQKFFFTHFTEEMESILNSPERDWKGRLQELIQSRSGEVPTYETVETKGPDHARTFVVVAKLAGKEIGKGEGASKKEAEKIAAKEALILLEEERVS